MEKEDHSYSSQKITAPPEFEHLFSHFYAAANGSKETIQKTLLPSFQTIMVFSFGTPVTFTSRRETTIEIGKVMVIGPIRQPLQYTLPPGADILVANFKGGAFYSFFGQALVTADAVHPDHLLGEDCFTGLWSILKNKNNMADRVGFILEFCKPYLKEKDGLLDRITHFKQDPSLNPIKIIAQETKLSERSIQLKHQKFLGYSAKEAGRYQRFLKALELLEGKISAAEQKPEGKIPSSGHNKILPSGQTMVSSEQTIDWFDIIEECGYYDQSQLIHDFQLYLHLSPTQYLKFQQDICIARPE